MALISTGVYGLNQKMCLMTTSWYMFYVGDGYSNMQPDPYNSGETLNINAGKFPRVIQVNSSGNAISFSENIVCFQSTETNGIIAAYRSLYPTDQIKFDRNGTTTRYSSTFMALGSTKRLSMSMSIDRTFTISIV